MIRLFFPLSFTDPSGGVVIVPNNAQWAYPADATTIRVFPPRVRDATAEMGHTENDDPYLDTRDR